MAKQDVYDPEFYTMMEKGLVLASDAPQEEKKDSTSEKNLTSRHVMGAVAAYWRSNCGAAWALKYWEQLLRKHSDDLHTFEVIELCQAFRENRTHHRDHMRALLKDHFKKTLLAKWGDQMEYHQRRVFELMKEMEHLEFYDEELWQACFDTISHKKSIQNLTFFAYFNESMTKFNTDPKSPFFKKLDDNIKTLKDKHYSANREWRYDAAEGRMRTLDELVGRREEAKIDDQQQSKGGVDQTMVQRAVDAEKKMKRLRMAKYSVELFDEIVTEMMKEKRTLMEMMAELDVDDEKILEAQQRITNRRLQAGLSIAVE